MARVYLSKNQMQFHLLTEIIKNKHSLTLQKS